MHLLKLSVLNTFKLNICFSRQWPNRKQTHLIQNKTFVYVSLWKLKYFEGSAEYFVLPLSPLGVISAHYNVIVVLSFENTIT